VELDRHRLLLRGELEILRNGASTEPDTCVFGKTPNKEVIFLLAVGGVFNVELVKCHLQLSLGRLYIPSAILVVRILAWVSW